MNIFEHYMKFSGLAYLKECPHPQKKGIEVFTYSRKGFVLKQRHSLAKWIGNFTFRNERTRKMNLTSTAVLTKGGLWLFLTHLIFPNL